MSEAYVYIVTNKRNGTLYTGSTTDLIKRIWEHKNKLQVGFTEKYNLNQLVFFEIHGDIMGAAERERKIKNWRRVWKIALIEKINPQWKDLYEEICC